jgi:hypothetical protein
LQRPQKILAQMMEIEVRQLLVGLCDDLEGHNRDGLKIMLAGLVDKIVLNPATRNCEIR